MQSILIWNMKVSKATIQEIYDKYQKRTFSPQICWTFYSKKVLTLGYQQVTIQSTLVANMQVVNAIVADI